MKNNLARREFLGLAAAAVAFPAFKPTATLAPYCHPGLHCYAWAEALRFWPTAEAGALRAVYLTLSHAEYPGLSAPEVTALALADVAPLIPLADVRHVAVAGGSGAQPDSWTCTCTTKDQVQLVITVRPANPEPPMLRGEFCDLEAREDELVLMSHEGEWLFFPVPEPPMAAEIARMRNQVTGEARTLSARALGVYQGHGNYGIDGRYGAYA